MAKVEKTAAEKLAEAKALIASLEKEATSGMSPEELEAFQLAEIEESQKRTEALRRDAESGLDSVLAKLGHYAATLQAWDIAPFAL